MTAAARAVGLRPGWGFAALLAGAVLAVPAFAEAQQRDSIPGVALGLLYEGGQFQPPLAVQPFSGRFGGQALAGQVEAIVVRDLRYSDRYRMMDSIPSALMREEAVDYALWDRLGAVWLLTGRVEGSGEGYVLVLELHDVVYARVEERASFRLPDDTDRGFRMAVHRASDEVVRWSTGEPGMAASRIALSLLRDGAKELYVVDSDGENLRRLTSYGGVVHSPTWSPDGGRLAFTSYHDTGNLEIFEMVLGSGAVKKLEVLREGLFLTPDYHPDGEIIAFAVQGGRRSGLFTYNLARGCCLTNLTETARIDVSPVYSPEGSFIAFNSGRLGDAIPQIYVMPADGGEAELLSPYEYGRPGYYTSPDWSPFGNLVAFHGRLGRYGSYHILVAEMGRDGRLTQLTWEGNNEDPTWAPDGRHIAFRGERSWGKGLFVVDTVTGAIRAVLSGVEVGEPGWSPALGPEAGR